jgi:hypothetical protein
VNDGDGWVVEAVVGDAARPALKALANAAEDEAAGDGADAAAGGEAKAPAAALLGLLSGKLGSVNVAVATGEPMAAADAPAAAADAEDGLATSARKACLASSAALSEAAFSAAAAELALTGVKGEAAACGEVAGDRAAEAEAAAAADACSASSAVGRRDETREGIFELAAAAAGASVLAVGEAAVGDAAA